MATFPIVALRTQGTASAGAAVTTVAADTTGSNLLIACVSNSAAAGAAALSDSASNSWTALTRSPNSGAVQIFYVVAPVTSTSHTFTIAATATNLASLTVLAVSNAAASPFDQQAVNTASQSTGSITPSTNGALVVAVYQDSSTTTGGSGASQNFFFSTRWPVVGGNRFFHCTAFQFQPTAAAITCTFDATGVNPSTAVASFKIGSGGGGGGSTGGSYAFS